jgi:hypothetical protein
LIFGICYAVTQEIWNFPEIPFGAGYMFGFGFQMSWELIFLKTPEWKDKYKDDAR